MTTFEQWANQVTYYEAMPEVVAGVYAGLPGRVYPAGFMVETDYGWMVPLPQDEREFHTVDAEVSYEEPERFLWDEWCDGELNA